LMEGGGGDGGAGVDLGAVARDVGVAARGLGFSGGGGGGDGGDAGGVTCTRGADGQQRLDAPGVPLTCRKHERRHAVVVVGVDEGAAGQQRRQEVGAPGLCRGLELIGRHGDLRAVQCVLMLDMISPVNLLPEQIASITEISPYFVDTKAALMNVDAGYSVENVDRIRAGWVGYLAVGSEGWHSTKRCVYVTREADVRGAQMCRYTRPRYQDTTDKISRL
jgi:hypothetical protein